MKINRINFSLMLVIAFLIINSCNNKYSIKYFDETTNLYNLKGKIKKVKSNVYGAKIVGNEIIKNEKIDSRFLGLNLELTFNEYGQLINEKQFSRDNKLKSETTFEYNRNGSIKNYKTSEIAVFYKYNEYDSIEKIITKSNDHKFKKVLKAEYDKNRQRTEEFELYNDSIAFSYTNTYNNRGELIERNKYNGDKELINQSKFYYKQKIIIKETSASIDSLKTGIGKITIKYKYQDDKLSEKRTIYNDSSFVSISYEYYNNGIIKNEHEFELNRNGKQSNFRENEYDSIGNITIYDIFDSIEYEYDSNSNWIKRIVFQSDYPSYIVYREIDYY